MNQRRALCLVGWAIYGACVLALSEQDTRADSTWVYAVQISASVQSSPPQITLHWQPDQYGANSYTVYRKSKAATTWGAPIASLPGSVTNHADSNVAVGTPYEYQIVKQGVLGYKGYGYIYSGIEAPLTESRGTLMLIVETNATATLSDELTRLQSDLVGDGWNVLRHGVSSNDTPESVRGLILNDYVADPANVNTIFLFGHVPVLHSGQINYDTHATRPMPADAYYGDVNNDWPTAPNLSPSFLPSDVKLTVGRVDFFNLPGVGGYRPWPSESELLRNYLNKDHRWRHKLVTVPRRALMGNQRGDEQGEATAASGYRNFEPLVGPGNTIEANVAFNAPNNQRWVSMLGAGSYLWAYGCGGGSPNGCGGLGTNIVNGVPGFVFSADVVGVDAKAVFVMLFGSWFGQWDLPDDLMRSFLATPSLGLTCCLAGRPHWFVHHMGLGETIGYSTRLSMNNRTLYQNQSNGLPRSVFIALMGDPTLRMEPLAPPTGLTAVANDGGVTLSWSASVDAVLGYHVYRADSLLGPFTRVTASLVAGTAFTDSTVIPGTYSYMVRAVALQTNPSGSYLNPSQGIFRTVDVTNPPPPIQLTATLTTQGLALTWNSQAGQFYRVMTQDDLAGTNWMDISGPLLATGNAASWTDASGGSRPQRFYQVSRP